MISKAQKSESAKAFDRRNLVGWSERVNKGVSEGLDTLMYVIFSAWNHDGASKKEYTGARTEEGRSDDCYRL